MPDMMIHSNTKSRGKPVEPTADTTSTTKSIKTTESLAKPAAPGVIVFVAEAKKTCEDEERAIAQMRLAIQPTLLIALILLYRKHNMPYDTVLTDSQITEAFKLEQTDCIFSIFYSGAQMMLYANYPTLMRKPAQSPPTPVTYEWKLVTLKLRVYQWKESMPMHVAWPIAVALLSVDMHRKRIEEKYKEDEVVEYLTSVDMISEPRPKPPPSEKAAQPSKPSKDYLSK